MTRIIRRQLWADSDAGFLIGCALIILAIAGLSYMSESDKRQCIAEHGTWKGDTCVFEETKP
jgi:hypothetical protein